MKCKVMKRTFEALNYPEGSAQRIELNKNTLTSEYLPSYKYCVTGENFSHACRTRKEAQERCLKSNRT